MRKDSGETIIIGLLVGLAVGLAMAYVGAGRQAQEIANATGEAQDVMPYMVDEPGDWVTIVGPAAAGAGVGWALDAVSDSGDSDRKSQDTDIRLNDLKYSTVNISLRGNSDDDTRTESREVVP